MAYCFLTTLNPTVNISFFIKKAKSFPKKSKIKRTVIKYNFYGPKIIIAYTSLKKLKANVRNLVITAKSILWSIRYYISPSIIIIDTID